MSDTDQSPPASESPKKRTITIRRKVKIRRKAGQRANLTKEIIAARAAELIEAGQVLVVLKLAQALGVVPATIKAHFPGGPGDIVTMIARMHLRGLARPFQLGDQPEAYMAELFSRLLEKTYGHPVLAQLVIVELSSNPYLDLEWIDRLLECALNLGAKPERLPSVLRRGIGRVCEMILTECVFGHALKPNSLRRDADNSLMTLRKAAPDLEADWRKPRPDVHTLAGPYASQMVDLMTEAAQHDL
jgi:AcrR family transcriptional regulator